MFRPHTVLGIGLWLIAIHFLGVPLAWRNGLYVLTGVFLVLVYLKYLWKETVVKFAVKQSHQTDAFVQNGVAHEETPLTQTGEKS